MNDDVDLLLCIHAKVYLQVTTCADRSQWGTLPFGGLRASTEVTLCTMVVQGIGVEL
jgi:hypothetical protein